MTLNLFNQDRGCLWVAAVFLLVVAGCSTEASRKAAISEQLIGVWEGQIDADSEPHEDSPLATIDSRILATAKITYKFKYNERMEIVNEISGQKATTRKKWRVVHVDEDRVTIAIRPQSKSSNASSTFLIEMVDDNQFQRVSDDGDGLTATFFRYLSNRE